MLIKSVLLPVSFLALLNGNIISAEKEELSDCPHQSSQIETPNTFFLLSPQGDEYEDGEDKTSLDRPSTPVHLIDHGLPRLAFPPPENPWENP